MSLKPNPRIASLTGQATASSTSGRAAAVASVQSRFEGSLWSPVKNTGYPCADQLVHEPERHVQGRGADLVLGREHLLDRGSVAEQLRPVLHVVEMDVEERDDLTRPDLDQRVPTLGTRRFVDRVLREELQAHVVVRVPGVRGDLGQAVVRLEHADDVRVHTPMTASVDSSPPYSTL